MKTRGYTSVSILLVPICDSLAHDIKHLNGIIVGSPGVFTNVVESHFAADYPTALLKLMYLSDMCIMARKVLFDRLPTNINCISIHCEP
jgi:hypothetical protein